MKKHYYIPTKELSKVYSRRGNAKRHVNNSLCIDGEYVTIEQIAERLGCSYDAARGRLNTLRTKPDPITWEALKGNK